MIEMCRLKNVVIFIQTILSFVLSRKIIPIEISSSAIGSKVCAATAGIKRYKSIIK